MPLSVQRCHLMVSDIYNIAGALVKDLQAGPAKYLLLRDIFNQQPDLQMLTNSAQVQGLSNTQYPDGSWGPFHSQSRRRKQAIRTTEFGVRRALALGLDKTHPVLSKALNYLVEVHSGKLPFPDRAEKNNRWETGKRLFTAAAIAWIDPYNLAIRPEVELWREIACRTFQSGEYCQEDETRAHDDLTGADVAGSYLTLRGKYQLTLLGCLESSLPESVETALLQWLFQLPDGIGYLTMPLAIPPIAHPGQLDRWFTSNELLARYFKGYRSFSSHSAEWIWSRQLEDGGWDFGERSVTSEVMPLSDNWRKNVHRRTDWTTRVLLLLQNIA